MIRASQPGRIPWKLIFAIGAIPSLVAVIELGRIHPDEVYQWLEPAFYRARGFRDVDLFFAALRRHLGPIGYDLEIEHGFHSVLRVMNRHLSAGEIEKLRSSLPKKLRELWPRQVSLPTKKTSLHLVGDPHQNIF